MRAHQFAALLHQFQGAFETQSLRRNQRRILAETVSGGHRGLQPVVGQLTEDLQAGDGMCQQCRLRISRQVQLIVRVPEGQFRDVVSEDVAGLRVDLPCDFVFVVHVAAHPRVLGTLAGKREKNVLCGVTHCDGSGGAGECEE